MKVEISLLRRLRWSRTRSVCYAILYWYQSRNCHLCGT